MVGVKCVRFKRADYFVTDKQEWRAKTSSPEEFPDVRRALKGIEGLQWITPLKMAQVWDKNPVVVTTWKQIERLDVKHDKNGFLISYSSISAASLERKIRLVAFATSKQLWESTGGYHKSGN